MYIDSHAHIFDQEYREDLQDVLDRAAEAGVGTVIVPGTNLETSREAVALSERFDSVFACVGIHPHESSEATGELVQAVEELSRHPKVVAIGEIGLDYYYDFSPKEKQREVFEAQLEVAVRRSLPVVIHTRDSMGDAMEIVGRTAGRFPEWRSEVKPGHRVQGSRGVFHCFTGTAEEARTLFSQGFYVSYPGIVTFKNSPVAAVVKEIGWTNILLETDSPYLTPVPYRGKRNEPSYVPLIANKIAELCETSPTEVGEATTTNTRTLFSLPE